MSFTELGLNPIILKAIEATGYTEPSPVQDQSIPAALTGADLLVSAHRPAPTVTASTSSAARTRPARRWPAPRST